MIFTGCFWAGFAFAFLLSAAILLSLIARIERIPPEERGPWDR